MTTERTRRALGILAIAAVLALVLGWLSMAQTTSAAGTGTLTVIPSSTTLTQGQNTTVTIQGNANVVTTGAGADFRFDETRFAVTDFQAGPAWAGATVISGIAPQTKAQSIASANATGVLENLATYCAPGNCTVPAGPATWITIQLHVLNNGGSSMFTLTQLSMIDVNGDPTTVSAVNAAVSVDGPISVGGVVETIVGSDGSQGILTPLNLVIAAALGAIVLATVGGGFALRKS